MGWLNCSVACMHFGRHAWRTLINGGGGGGIMTSSYQWHFHDNTLKMVVKIVQYQHQLLNWVYIDLHYTMMMDSWWSSIGIVYVQVRFSECNVSNIASTCCICSQCYCMHGVVQGSTVGVNDANVCIMYVYCHWQSVQQMAMYQRLTCTYTKHLTTQLSWLY